MLEEEEEENLINSESNTPLLHGSLPIKSTQTSNLKKIYYNLVVSFNYVIKDMMSDKRGFLIGFFTVSLVVVFTLLLENSISRSPIIFLKMQEDQIGEYDMLLTGNYALTKTPFLNFTSLDAAVKARAPLVSGATPRWIMLGKSADAKTPLINTSSTFLMIDCEREKQIGLGRSWHHRILGPNEAHVSRSLLSFLGVPAGRGAQLLLTVDLLGLASQTGVVNESVADMGALLLENFVSQTLNLTVDYQTTSLRDFLQSLEPLIGPQAKQLPQLVTLLFPEAELDKPADVFFQILADRIHSLLIIRRRMTVIDSISEPRGKFPKALGNVVLVDKSLASEVVQQVISSAEDGIDNYSKLLASFALLQPQFQQLVQQLLIILNLIQNQLDQFSKDFKIDDFTLSVIMQYQNRFSAYLKDSKGLDKEMIHWTNQVADAIGTDFPSSITLPLTSALQPILFLRLMLEQIFTVVEFVLMGLGALLIYSLLISNVDEKTYEYGMLRALGMRHYSLISLLSFQSLFFSIPALLIGIFVGWLCFIPVAFQIADYAVSPVLLSLDNSAVIFAVVIGLVMPLLSLIGPVNRALSHTLRDALDVYHQIMAETSVAILRLENMGLSPWQMVSSALMTFCGFVIYYLIPWSFTFRNFSLFFFIMTCILVGILLGLSIISQVLQPFIERLLVYLIIWGDDRRCLTTLVQKHLLSHGSRNQKTGMMFTTALAFIIFAGSSFTLQGQTIQDTVRLYFGGDLVVNAPFLTTVTLPENDMRTFLDRMMNHSKSISGYTFVAGPIGANELVQSVTISNLVNFPPMIPLIYGVEKNYLRQTFSEFYIPTVIDSKFSYRSVDGKSDIVQSLFDDAGKTRFPRDLDQPKAELFGVSHHNFTQYTTNVKLLNDSYTRYLDVILSAALIPSASLKINRPVRLSFSFMKNNSYSYQMPFLAKPRAFVQTMPGFLFSSYRETAFVAPLLISMDQYSELMQEFHNHSDWANQTLSIPAKRILIVNLKNGISNQDKEEVINGLRNFITNDFIQIFDTVEIVASTQIALDLLNFFFELVSTIAIVLSFFVLWLSFTANVRENAWEFAVLRAIGLTSWQLVRAYIYEALCVVLSSVLLSLVIGCTVSLTLTLQYDLFTQLPFKFNFPTVLFLLVFLMSVIVAIIGSYLPSRKITSSSVASALKHL